MKALLRFGVAWGLAVIAGAILGDAPALGADSALLASTCSGCHTGSARITTAIPRIAGLPEVVLAEAMRAFRAGQRPATVMDRIAKGFTEDEITQLAAYFSSRW
jgi:sulfide dehydrogenase cytochrome subunit